MTFTGFQQSAKSFRHYTDLFYVILNEVKNQKKLKIKVFPLGEEGQGE